MNKSKLGPWPDMVTARSFLGFLAGTYPSFNINAPDIDHKQVALWLVEQGIAPLAFDLCRSECPALASYLQHDAFSTVAQNSLHWQILEDINTSFAKHDIPIVLLKGAALAHTVYGGRDQRTMSDVDIWLQKSDIEPACNLMDKLGFQRVEKESRPFALQMILDGEIQFFRSGWQQGLVEFHLSPFSGWWLTRTAAIDNNAIRSRIERIHGLPSTYYLSAEDAMMNIAVHMTVNHQCGFWPIRSLMDLALIANKRVVNWDLVTKRAKDWRVGNAVWLALYLLQRLFGVDGLEKILRELQPPYWKSRYMLKLVNPERIILGSDLRSGRTRYILLLLLVDRNWDTGLLIYRTLWPEKSWLFARYGHPVGHWHHLNRIIRLDES